MIREILGRVSGGQDLSMDEMAGAIDAIMQGQVHDEEIGLLLMALRHKGETVDEIAGAARAMRKHMTPIRTTRENVIDTCGTGGDGSGTFNISTAAAIVTAAAGVPVAKHGNRKITSKTGSADVLTALGVNIEASVATVERCIDELGLGFCFAPLLHPSMKHVAAVRRSLGVPTIFNLLGPLANPASADFQLLGVGKPELRPRLSAALAKLEIRRAVVVCGEDGLDEVTIATATQGTLVEGNSTSELRWEPSDFGITSASLDALQAPDPDASAAVIRNVLEGQAGPAKDIVVLNAAAALWTAGHDSNLVNCQQQATAAIDSGAARELLANLGQVSHS
ncbi:MAG: anthranilate phosphoribosyltransferase [Blastopirellula sp.]|nr:anthranilate phosphoribosyltransferase [Blastopirellula sp.]